MANDLATLRGRLSVAVSDTAFGYWTSAEMDTTVQDAVNNLWPRYGARLSSEASLVTLVADQAWYALPANIAEVDKVFLLDATGKIVMEMPPGTWMTEFNTTGSRILINSDYTSIGTQLRISGLARYNVTTVLIPDDLADLVVAQARAELYRRALGDRMRFKQWATSNQVENVSVNEMVQIINESERKAEELRVRAPRTWRRPVPARV